MIKFLCFFFVFGLVESQINEKLGICSKKNPSNVDNSLQNSDSSVQSPSDLIRNGKKLCAQQNFEKAIILFNEAVRRQPNDESHAARGLCYQQMGVKNLAAADFAKIKALYSNDDSEYPKMQLIRSCMDIGDWKLAEFVTLILWKNENLLQIAKEFCLRERFDEAIACYARANMNYPKADLNYKTRGECYIRKRDMDAAIQDFEKAAELDRTVSRDEKKEYGRVLLCLALFNMGKFKHILNSEIYALNDFQVAKLADKLLEERKFESAIYCYSEAIAKSPQKADYYKKRGKCYLTIENFEMAAFDFKHVMKLDPLCQDCIADLQKAEAGL